MHRRTSQILTLLLTVLTLGALLPATPAKAADDYPFRAAALTLDPWTFTTRQCTSFAAWRLAQRGQAGLVAHWGDAHRWNNEAYARGMIITTRPRGYAIAAWEPYETSPLYRGVELRPVGTFRAGSRGHVAVVAWHYSDGTALVEQYNAFNPLGYGLMRVRAPRYIWVGF